MNISVLTRLIEKFKTWSLSPDLAPMPESRVEKLQASADSLPQAPHKHEYAIQQVVESWAITRNNRPIIIVGAGEYARERASQIADRMNRNEQIRIRNNQCGNCA
jgi:hypothetical protein